MEEFVRYAKRHKLKQIILDCDATDVPLHGNQEGRFFHGYYGHYCYLPLYIFCEEFPLWAELRPSNIDASQGTEEALSKIVGQLRRKLKNTPLANAEVLSIRLKLIKLAAKVTVSARRV